MSANDQVIVTSPLGKDKLSLRKLNMRDALSTPFEIEVMLASADFDIDLDRLLGAGLGVEIKPHEGERRFFHGLVAHIELAGTAPRAAIFRATLRPWLWFLRHKKDCRIFQNETVPEILKHVFKGNGFVDFSDRGLGGTYEKRDYCVQYCESDFDFVCRLMEDEGIYYHFTHEADRHKLILCDSMAAHSSASGYANTLYRPHQGTGHYQSEALFEWRETRAITSGAYALRDYDFEHPKANLEARARTPSKHARADFEVFEYPGSCAKAAQASAYAKLRLEALQVPYQRYSGAGNLRGVGVGHLITLAEHPRTGLNKEYLVIGAEHEVVSAEHELGSTADLSSCEFTTRYEAIDSKRVFRPARVTPRAAMPGPQTAVVVGPSGKELFADKYGRVKVAFPWDRYGHGDETSSCWIRVSQAWAGKQWGQFFLPRVGQEVIVDFLDGDPDRPIITGGVHNADQMPPYELPGNQTRSTIKTRSSPDGSDENFNELRFEDKKGAEEIYFHAERDFNRVVENNDTLKVGFQKKENGNQIVEIFNNQNLTIGNEEAGEGNQTISVWKDRATTIHTGDDTLKLAKGSQTAIIDKDRTTTLNTGNETLTVSQGNRKATVHGNDDLTVTTGNQSVRIQAGAQTTEAMQSITFKVGQNSITIDQSGITIKALQIKLEAQTTLDLKGLLSTLKADALTTVKGAMVLVN
jgi:type VI secretion system secreted protein VgrG